ncbi:MAG: hypothetical protein ACE5E5_13480 [Phycisphaerae bacterium]
MIARYIASGLGLFAFAVAVFAGLLAGNAVAPTLSRGITALFLFCFIGYLLGLVAQRVVSEHKRTRESEIRSQYRQDLTSEAREGEEARSEPAMEAPTA